MNRDLIRAGRWLILCSVLLLVFLLIPALVGETAELHNRRTGPNSRPVKQSTANRPLASGSVPQARVNPHVIKLPVVEGDDLRFKRLSTAEGLSQTRVAQIVQGDLGFIWFGTQYGLNRYDGYEFKVFSHQPGNLNSLSCVYIGSLFKDRSGTFWIGCDQFLDRFDPTTETFAHYRITDRGGQGPGLAVRHISQDHTGRLWLATTAGLFQLDPNTGQLTGYHHDPSNPSSISSDNVKSTGEDREGEFWVANGEGLDKFDRETNKVILHIPLGEEVSRRLGTYEQETSFYEDRSGKFWILSTSGDGLAVFDRRTNELRRYSFPQDQKSGAPFSGLIAMVEDGDDSLWLGTVGNGLLKFDRKRQLVIRYRNHPGNVDSLSDDRLTALVIDKEGNIWVGLNGTGPNFFSTRRVPFQTIAAVSSNRSGETFVNAIYEDRLGILWTGTTGALDRGYRRDGRFILSEVQGIGDTVVAINEDRQGDLWLGTWDKGLIRFNRRTGVRRRYRHNASDPHSLSSDTVPQVIVDHAGTLWMATWDGVDRFDPTSERFETFKPPGQTGQVGYFVLTEDPQGVLWLGSETSGLHRFVPSTGEFTVYKQNPSDPWSLSDNRINAVYVDHSGTLWVGTQNGLDKLDAQSGTFTNYYERDGLSGNLVGCILEDATDKLWMSTNKGLSRFDPLTQKFENYSIADGLPGEDFTGWCPCFKNSKGEMYFGGFVGATTFDPTQMKNYSPYIPPIALTDLQLSGTSVQVGPGSPLKKSVTYADGVTLSHQQATFSLEFSALSFRSAATNRYRYKLERLDRDWTQVNSTHRQVTYTALSPGTYTFRVQGATIRGAWSEPGVALRVEILPPWWATVWLRLVTGALILCLLGSLYRLRMRQLEREFNAGLEARVSERTRIARELHDTLLQSFHGLMLRFQAASNLFATRPAESKLTLDSAIDEATQAITEGRDAIEGLRSFQADTNDFALEIKSIGVGLVAHGTNENSAVLRVNVAGTPRRLNPIVRDEVYQITAEALRNAFRHAHARRIEVDIQYDDRQFRLRVRDDGKGFDPKVLGRKVRPGHYGLNGMSERAKLVGGELDVWSEVASGTEVELTISASKVYAKSSVRGRWPLSEIFARKSTEMKS